MNRLETHTNPLRLFLFVGKDEGVMQRNEMLFCKGRMGDKTNHFLSFGRMQPTSCTKGTKDLAVPNNSSPCYCHIAAYLNNVFVKPNEQCRACSNIVMARKRTFRGTKKEHFCLFTVHLCLSSSNSYLAIIKPPTIYTKTHLATLYFITFRLLT